MAVKCGYPLGNITADAAAGTPRTLTVTITASEPFFFAKVLGYASKMVTATAVGQAAGSVPAINAGSNMCTGTPTPTGIQFNGGPISVVGDTESNGNCQHLRQRDNLGHVDLRLRAAVRRTRRAPRARVARSPLRFLIHDEQLRKLHVRVADHTW